MTPPARQVEVITHIYASLDFVTEIPYQHFKYKYILYLFSGPRRYNDVQHVSVQHTSRQQVPVIVLDIDIIHGAHHNRKDDRLVKHLQTLIRGQLQLRCDGCSCTFGWALRPPKLYERLATGNTSLINFLLLQWTAYVKGVATLREHPAAYRNKASSWFTGIEIEFYKLPRTRTLQAHQCMLGSPTLKPTTFGSSNFQENLTVLNNLPHGYACKSTREANTCGHPHLRLYGKDAHGNWKTTVHKTFPAGVCTALGLSLAEHSIASLPSGPLSGPRAMTPRFSLLPPLDPYLPVSSPRCAPDFASQ